MMARTRQVKPEFFTDEKLWQLDDLTIILFEALWCLADREGRLQDNIIFIHGNCLPHRPKAKVDDMLTSLHNREFITRYSRNGCKYIQINNFTLHQNLHPNEKESQIPCFNREEIANESRIARSPSSSTSTSTSTSIDSAAIADRSEFVEIINHYNLKTKRDWSLTDARKKMLKARLKQFTVEQLKDAIDGITSRPHNLGQNQTNTVYLDFELIFRSDAQVDKYRQDRVAKKPATVKYYEPPPEPTAEEKEMRARIAKQAGELAKELRQKTGELK